MTNDQEQGQWIPSNRDKTDMNLAWNEKDGIPQEIQGISPVYGHIRFGIQETVHNDICTISLNAHWLL